MKNLIIITTCSILLLSCRKSKQASLREMCECMEESSSNSTGVLSPNEIALDCAKQMREKDNLSHESMLRLYNDFGESLCGQLYGVNNTNGSGSGDVRTEDYRERENTGYSDPAPGEFTNQAADTDTISYPEVPAGGWPDTASGTGIETPTGAPYGSTEPMSDEEAYKLLEQHVNPTLEKYGETSVKRDIVANYPARPVEYPRPVDISYFGLTELERALKWLEKERLRGAYTTEEIEQMTREAKEKAAKQKN